MIVGLVPYVIILFFMPDNFNKCKSILLGWLRSSSTPAKAAIIELESLSSFTVLKINSISVLIYNIHTF